MRVYKTNDKENHGHLNKVIKSNGDQHIMVVFPCEQTMQMILSWLYVWT